MAAEKTEYINLRVTPEFKKEVEELAAKECRTVTSLIEWLLTKEIEKQK